VRRRPGLAAPLAAALALGLALAAGPAPAVAESSAGVVSRSRLPNGLTVLVRQNPAAPVVAVSLMVRMGTRWETRETAGTSNLLQLMVVRGTTSLSGIQIVETADRLGGSIEALGDADFSEISGTALSRYWKEILGLVADVALHPSVPEGTFQAVRDFLVRQIRNRGDKPYDVALDTLTARIFAPHPYAWDPIGLKESLERVDRPALLAHYRKHYVPGGMVLAVSGKVKAPEVLAEAQRLFGAMTPGPVPAPTAARPPAPAASREVLRVPGAQAQILMGSLAPRLTDPDHAAVKVMSTVLGGGMAGRFFSELRDKQALAYTTGTQYPARADTGYFLAQLGTGPENTAQAETALNRQLERIQREPIADAELQVARAYVLGNLAMDRRTNARQAWYLAAYEVSGVGYEFLDRYIAQVRQVTAVDVQRVARRYLAPLRTVIVEPPGR
jgi:predicted Zn-dependent peptidase